MNFVLNILIGKKEFKIKLYNDVISEKVLVVIKSVYMGKLWKLETKSVLNNLKNGTKKSDLLK